MALGVMSLPLPGIRTLFVFSSPPARQEAVTTKAFQEASCSVVALPYWDHIGSQRLSHADLTFLLTQQLFEQFISKLHVVLGEEKTYLEIRNQLFCNFLLIFIFISHLHWSAWTGIFQMSCQNLSQGKYDDNFSCLFHDPSFTFVVGTVRNYCGGVLGYTLRYV